MARLPIAFYAPLKSPRHPAPSGDRTMARLLMKALAEAGFEPHLASELRTIDRHGEVRDQERLKSDSERCAAKLLEGYRSHPRVENPRLWFTYHVYYKAPDWIGPLVSRALGIPYVVAEGSRAGKRADGPWALSHRGAEAALDHASLVFAMTGRDQEALDRARPPGQTVLRLPPFLDLEAWEHPPAQQPGSAAPRLLCVAMMREGDKLASYRILAEALGALQDLPWTLDVVGDGPARGDVERRLTPFGSRIRLHGQLDRPRDVAVLYAEADLLVWPAVNEAYGMVLLEAQAFGCPVVAGAFGGVPSVVSDGLTGLLTTPGDALALSAGIRRLLTDPAMRREMGRRALRFVSEERSLVAAAERLRSALMPLAMQDQVQSCGS